MNGVDVTSIIGIMTLGVAAFFLVYALSLFNKNLSGKILFALFAVLSLNLGYNLLIDTKVIQNFPLLYALLNKGYALQLLIYPLLLAFIQSYNRSSFQKTLFLLLLIPPVWLFGESLIRILFIDFEIIQNQVDLFLEDNRPGPENIMISPLLFIFSILIPGFVLYKIFRELRFFFKDAVFKDTKYFMAICASIAALIFLLRFSSYPIQIFFFREMSVSFIEWKVEIIFNSIFILILAFSTLMYIRLEELGEVKLEYETKKTAALTGQDLKKISTLINQTVTTNELYKNPGLTLDELSGILAINTRYLSLALNQEIGMSFPEYINGCRLECAKKLILSDAIKDYSIEAIGQESGFNSRATFYRVFKEDTGYSPLAFRKKYSES